MQQNQFCYHMPNDFKFLLAVADQALGYGDRAPADRLFNDLHGQIKTLTRELDCLREEP